MYFNVKIIGLISNIICRFVYDLDLNKIADFDLPKEMKEGEINKIGSFNIIYNRLGIN